MSLAVRYAIMALVCHAKSIASLWAITFGICLCLYVYTGLGMLWSGVIHLAFVLVVHSLFVYRNYRNYYKFIDYVRDNYDESKKFFETNGERIMSAYDPNVIIGILGGENIFPFRGEKDQSYFGFTTHNHDKMYYRRELVRYFEEKSRHI